MVTRMDDLIEVGHQIVGMGNGIGIGVGRECEDERDSV